MRALLWGALALRLARREAEAVGNTSSNGGFHVTDVEALQPCPQVVQRTCFSQALTPPEQAKTARLLAAFHTALQAGKADYTLAFGNLLGLSRSGGRIPWDDDVDVLLPNHVVGHCGQCMGALTPCTCAAATVFPEATRASFAAQGLEIQDWSAHNVGNRPFFKVFFRAGHPDVINTLTTPYRTFPFVDVFIDVPYADGGLCTECWPTRTVLYDGSWVRAPQDAGVDRALEVLFQVPATELRSQCNDKCRSHCRGFDLVCTCAPQSCEAAYAPFLLDTGPWTGTKTLLHADGSQAEATSPLAAATQDLVGRSHEDTLARLVVGILVASVLAAAWAERDNLSSSSSAELLATLSVGLYLATTVACDIFIQLFWQSTKDGFAFHPQVLVCLCEACKFCICLMLAHAQGWDVDVLKIGKWMLAPALCFLYLNLLRFYALAHVHLGEYRVWRATDVLFTSFIWWLFFQKRLSGLQLGGVGMVFGACVLLSLDAESEVGWMTAVVLSMALASSLGLVANERAFREPGSFLAQNCVLYAVTSVLGAGVCAVTVPAGEYFQGIEGLVFAFVGLEVCMGLCVAVVLKYANAVIKSLASPWLTPLELVLGHYHVGTPLTVYTVLAALCAGLGNLSYRLGSQKPEKASVPLAAAKA